MHGDDVRGEKGLLKSDDTRGIEVRNLVKEVREVCRRDEMMRDMISCE